MFLIIFCLYAKPLLRWVPMRKHLAVLQCSGGSPAACMGWRKQPIERLHFKVAKGEIISANTRHSMASGAASTEYSKSKSSLLFQIYGFVHQSITLWADILAGYGA